MSGPECWEGNLLVYFEDKEWVVGESREEVEKWVGHPQVKSRITIFLRCVFGVP